MRPVAVLALIIVAALLAIDCGAYFFRAVQDVDAFGRKPALVTEFGDRVPIAQSLTPARDGFHSMTVSIVSDQDAIIGFEFYLIRKGIRADWPDEPILKRTVQRSVSAGITQQTIDFEPVTRSKARMFVATFTLTDAMLRGSSAQAPHIALAAWSDDAYRGGWLKVGPADRWGDLQFSAQVDPPTRLARLAGTVDAMLGIHTGRIGYAAAGLAYLALIAIICAAGVFSPRRTDPWAAAVRDAAEAEQPRTPAFRWIRMAGSLMLAIGTPVLLTAIVVTRARVSVNLIDQLDTAQMESPQGMHIGFSRIEEVINGVSPQALFAHAPSRITWKVHVPTEQPWLRASVALRPSVWDQTTDGVVFEMSVTDGATETKRTRHLNPRTRFGDRGWIEMAIDLSPYAGREIAVSLATSPGPRGDVAWDWAMWGDPRVVSLRWFDRYGRAIRDLKRESSGD